MVIGKGGGQLAQATGGQGTQSPWTEGHFPDSSFGLLALLPGTLSVNLFSAHHLLWEQGLTTRGFGAHFPCPQAQWEPRALLSSPELGQ